MLLQILTKHSDLWSLPNFFLQWLRSRVPRKQLASMPREMAMLPACKRFIIKELIIIIVYLERAHDIELDPLIM